MTKESWISRTNNYGKLKHTTSKTQSAEHIESYLTILAFLLGISVHHDSLVVFWPKAVTVLFKEDTFNEK